jgi:hypothetical protein
MVQLTVFNEMKNSTYLICILIMLAFSSFISCSSQNQVITNADYIYGVWKCVKHDYRGFNSIELEQAEKIKISKLHIEKNNAYYENIGFISECKFSKFKVSTYDTLEHTGLILEFRYKKKELSKMLEYEPVDENGKFSCFNNCAIFYLKQDTLINICGGYTYFLIKDK